jgi:hypothetical protein
MTQPLIRLLIQEKLAAGRLPYNSIRRYWGGTGNGETRDACEETVIKDQRAIENRDATGGVYFHVACFFLWNVERQLPGHEPRRAAILVDSPDGAAERLGRSANLRF